VAGTSTWIDHGGGALRHEHRRRAIGVSGTAIGGERRRDGGRLSRFRSTSVSAGIPDSLERIRNLPIVTARGARILLSDVAAVQIVDGPPMLKSENARLSGWVYVDIRGRDLRSAVQDMQHAVAEHVKVPPGYSVSWSGQFEFLERAAARLKVVVPFTLLIILVLLYLTFRRFDEALLIMAALPFALVGGVWLLYLLGHNISRRQCRRLHRARWRLGRIRRDHVAHLRTAWNERLEGKTGTEDLLDAIREGASCACARKR
jgi:Cu(I)/Ag(I) efflux system membrane protein CusA/SilA